MSLSGCACFQCVSDCELYCRHCPFPLWELLGPVSQSFQMCLLSSSVNCGFCRSTAVPFAVCVLWPMRLYLLLIYCGGFAIVHANVNCQAWGGLKRFSKAWLDFIEGKVSVNQDWKPECRLSLTDMPPFPTAAWGKWKLCSIMWNLNKACVSVV